MIVEQQPVAVCHQVASAELPVPMALPMALPHGCLKARLWDVQMTLLLVLVVTLLLGYMCLDPSPSRDSQLVLSKSPLKVAVQHLWMPRLHQVHQIR